MLDDSQLQELVEGLEANNINRFPTLSFIFIFIPCNVRYSHIINGYIGSKSFLTKFGEVVKKLKEVRAAQPCPVPDIFPGES